MVAPTGPNYNASRPPGQDDRARNLTQVVREVGRQLGITLQNALQAVGLRPRNNAQQQPPADGNAAVPPQAPGAANANAPAAPAAPAVDAKEWLQTNCAQIKAALRTKNDAGAVRNRNQILKDLHEAACELHTSFSTNRESIINSLPALPADLQADFEANIAVITEYFSSTDPERCISQNELRFLHSYINHLKTCIAGDQSELNKSLDDMTSEIGKLLTKVTKKIDNARDKVERINKIATELETTAGRTGTEADQRRAGTERNNANEAARKLEELTELPEAKTVRTFTEKLGEIDRELADLRNQQAAHAPQEEIDTTNEQIRVKDIERHAADAKLQTATEDLEQAPARNIRGNEITQNLITVGRNSGIAAVLVGAEAEALPTHVMGQLQQQLEDVTCLASASKKKPDTDWLKQAKIFNQQIEQLSIDGNINTEIPEAFLQLTPPDQPKIIGKIIGDKSIYDRAVEILDHNGTDYIVTSNDKKLALTILSGLCVMQSVRGNDNHVAYGKAFDPVVAASHLLAASLISKQGPESPQEFKTELIKLATEFNTDHAESDKVNLDNVIETLSTLPDYPDMEILNALPGDAARVAMEEVVTTFTQGVNLEVAKSFVKGSCSASFLLNKASTDRTYENDVTVASGASRQTVFKESMLSAIEILKTRPDSETDSAKPRMWRATNATLNTGPDHIDHINGLLGLGNDARLNTNSALLDQLVIASAAHNDLSTKDNFVSRGCLLTHIDKFDQSSTVGFLKNHNLHGFNNLSKVLTDIGMQIRSEVETRIDAMDVNLGAVNPLPISRAEIQQLVKQIIVTTDAQSASNQNFNLKKLVDSANALSELNTTENRVAFRAVLTNVKAAWDATSNENRPLERSDWRVEDKRSFLGKALKANLIKSMPVVNQIPGVSRAAAATANIAKFLILGSTGAAGGAVVAAAGIAAVAGVIGGAVVAAPVYGAYEAVKRAL